MKEPTGNTEAELQYWQKRALQAEMEIRSLETELEFLHKEVRYLEGQLETERYSDRERYDD